jgi:hypothetical protein
MPPTGARAPSPLGESLDDLRAKTAAPDQGEEPWADVMLADGLGDADFFDAAVKVQTPVLTEGTETDRKRVAV